MSSTRRKGPELNTLEPRDMPFWVVGHFWSNGECQAQGEKGPELNTLAPRDMPFLGSGPLLGK